MAEKHPSKLENNFDVLVREMDKLKGLRNKMVNRGEKHMHKWFQDVESKEDEMDEIRKAIDDLKNLLYHKRLERRTSLNSKVLESLKHVKHLNEMSYRNAEDVEKFISTALSDKPRRFSVEELKTFTTNEVIGEGTYGTVYKGKIGNKEVAVKVLKGDLSGAIKEKHFTAEVSTMMEVSHRNLVKFYGFCFEYNAKAFVYELMENGSLDKYLYEKHSTVEWEELYGIMVETAMGISYLHEYCNKGIIHRDINSSNVLLDKNHSPKIADFGLAKIYNRDSGQTKLTTGFMGTTGFDAPEVRLGHRNITSRCDVFSYGVMLFEMLNMRKFKDQGSFPKQVWEKFEKDELDELLTECGIAGDDVASGKTLATVALACTQTLAEHRPSMNDVVKILEGEKELPTPGKPFLSDDIFSSFVCSSALAVGPTSSQPVYRRL